MNLESPSELQLDALREVANIGCGHAASALSQLVGGRKVQIDVPRVVVTAVSEMSVMLGGADAKVVAALLTMHGELSGHLILVLPEKDAQLLCSLLLNAPCELPLSEVQKSALGEAANIVASACLTAIGTLTGLRLLPSTPTLSQDEAGAVIEGALSKTQTPTGLLVVLEAKFHTAIAPSIGGQLLVLPDRTSLKTLLSKLGV
jgi:chemotaxis protein CheC